MGIFCSDRSKKINFLRFSFSEGEREERGRFLTRTLIRNKYYRFRFLSGKECGGKSVMMKKLLHGRGDPREDILFGSKQENKFFAI